MDTRQAYYYRVFRAVSNRSRPVGGMAGQQLAIPVSAILDYCVLYSIHSEDQRDRIFRYLSEMDDTYLAHVSKNQTK